MCLLYNRDVSLFLPLLASLIGCVAIQPLSGEEICAEVGYGVAQRTLSCTDDPLLANKRYEQFDKQLSCTVTDAARAPVDLYLECAVAVNAVDCDVLEGHGDDIVTLVSEASPQCSRIFAEIETAVRPDDWESPNNGLGVNPFFGIIPATNLCPNPAQGNDVVVTINNPRAEPVYVSRVLLPCREQPVELEVPAGGTAEITGPRASVLRVRSVLGAMIADSGFDDDVVVEVPP